MTSIPCFLEADLHGKTVLVRMDHNVVKKGKIKDPMRIEATIPTLLHIFKKGGRPILMSHVGRPYNKATGAITISEGEAVGPIVKYLEDKLQLRGLIPDCPAEGEKGITDLSPIGAAVSAMKEGKADFVYLPNTRWFKGEESKNEDSDALAAKLASFADLFINDAFGSWQPHASTFNITKYLPSYAGLLMLKEIANLQKVFEPRKPLVSVVAGSKFDTKIGPLSSLIKISDKLVLGGVLYNAYLAVKYQIGIKGLEPSDLEMAEKFLQEAGPLKDRIVEPPYIIESDSFENAESWRVHKISDLKPGTQLNYVLDVAPESFSEPAVQEVFAGAATVFVNAVMGYTALFTEGTKAMYSLIDKNTGAQKLFGGGDTIQDFRGLLPGIFAKAVNDPQYYFFTGGGAVLDSIVNGSPYGMKPVQALIKES
ncbi:MAG TPA: phosphoglycerate kinase [Candidatus Syntrophosphaera sp.]|jgi:phosphoglycerate kinase|nr:phosphoglycerate kinase [Candidatus Cloacimonadota bacterium]OQB90292.1 MAG: Phosphoglycerate kinase [Candidatus Cloacimonetes bacterium ADurb.Bin117]HOR02753.1 phosphoglycerate kinase [Candidatus Syntrophosphaera sp.]NLH94025.1 phosphoglycerate kinase [Candidatus Cloacimonadota bacterium]HOG31166.1 phosphoglycerate kinase [Candidatus Cloacimonadota bacterium]